MPKNWLTTAVAFGKALVVPIITPSAIMAVGPTDPGGNARHGVTANKDNAAVAIDTKDNIMGKKKIGWEILVN